MLEIDIPRFGLVKVEHLVSDFTGTLSFDGKLLPGVKEQLNRIAEFLKLLFYIKFHVNTPINYQIILA